mmetsp:Transcript_59835/g.159263  ORF Transcript_59835/g.159263 Transcript_59835/m.159263 type:complete len:205 (+) Transcript_59835:1120-1734(+)
MVHPPRAQAPLLPLLTIAVSCKAALHQGRDPPLFRLPHLHRPDTHRLLISVASSVVPLSCRKRSLRQHQVPLLEGVQNAFLVTSRQMECRHWVCRRETHQRDETAALPCHNSPSLALFVHLRHHVLPVHDLLRLLLLRARVHGPVKLVCLSRPRHPILTLDRLQQVRWCLSPSYLSRRFPRLYLLAVVAPHLQPSVPFPVLTRA